MQRFCTLTLVLAVCAAWSSNAVAQHGFRDDGRFRDDSRFRGDDRFRNARGPDRVRRSYVFASKSYVEELAKDLYRHANSTCWEMHRHYQRNREYKATYAEMYQIRECAKEIEDLVGQSYHRRRHSEDLIERELSEIDRLFHHIERDVRDWRPDTPLAYRGDNLQDKMQRCEEALHDLMEDYGVKGRDWDHAKSDGPDFPRRPPFRR